MKLQVFIRVSPHTYTLSRLNIKTTISWTLITSLQCPKFCQGTRDLGIHVDATSHKPSAKPVKNATLNTKKRVICCLWKQIFLVYFFYLWPKSTQPSLSSSGHLFQIWRNSVKVFLRYHVHKNRMDNRKTQCLWLWFFRWCGGIKTLPRKPGNLGENRHMK